MMRSLHSALLPALIFPLLVCIDEARCTDLLVVIPDHYGANTNFCLDLFRSWGWNVTTAGITQSVQPCHSDLPVFQCDTILDSLSSADSFQAVAIMPSSWRYQPNPYGDITSNPHSMALLENAVADMPLWLTCVGPRIPALGDFLQGVEIQGQPGSSGEYLQEYLAAGAVYLGIGLPPVFSENFITTTRGQYYQRENCRAILTALIPDSVNGVTSSQRPKIICEFTSLQEKQTWSASYGGSQADGFADVCSEDSGNLTAAGYTFSFGNGNSDCLIVSVDSLGNVNWSLTWGGTGWEYARAICKTADGGYAVTGYTTSSGSGKEDIFLLKLDSHGDLLWSTTMGAEGTDIGESVLETQEGVLVVAGHTQPEGFGDSDMYLAMVDSTGYMISETTFGFSGPETADMVICTDSCLVTAGSTGSFTSNMDALIAAFDFHGNLMWMNYYEGTGGDGGYDRANALVELSSGGYALVGDTNTDDKCGLFLVVSDSLGNESFADCYGYSFYDYGNSILQLPDESYILCGGTKTRTNNLLDCLLCKIDPQGYTVWSERYGEPEDWETGNSVVSPGGNAIVVAGQRGSSESADGWLFRVEDDCFGVEEDPPAAQLRIDRNPGRGSITVQTGRTSSVALSVYDLSGRRVARLASVNNGDILDFSDLNTGIYILREERTSVGIRFTILP